MQKVYFDTFSVDLSAVCFVFVFFSATEMLGVFFLQDTTVRGPGGGAVEILLKIRNVFQIDSV